MADYLLAMFISMMVTALYYVPHFCLQQLLYHIDAGSRPQTLIAYATLMLLSRFANIIVMIKHFVYVVMQIPLCHMPRTDNTESCSRWQNHSNIEPFFWCSGEDCTLQTICIDPTPTSSKLLTRNIYAKPKMTSGTQAKIAHSKAEVLNLVNNDAGRVGGIGGACLKLFNTLVEALMGCGYIYILMGELV